ncbi:phospholipase D-like domain-containing protein [Neobacillus sp. NPDC093127]|uniref:phospholipase D-like domain-containing protein n=1 Tax=Neobacillus sp. NPDC093127 TaxID=3364296 RepID=UPI0037F732B4
MNLKPFTLNELKDLIAVEQGESPYYSGPKLVKFFNQVGIRDVYGPRGFTGDGLSSKSSISRKAYALNRLEKINGSIQFKNFMEYFVNYLSSQLDLDEETEFITKINKIIKLDGYSIEKIDEKYIITGVEIYDEYIEAKVHFEDIQKQIIDEIRKAKYTIWVAIAWFTDEILFKELVSKSKQGLNVQVIICDDQINTKGGLQFKDYFETYKLSQWGWYGNIMHNKFCIIDLKTVISGSYNWTKKAQYNAESIEVKHGRDLAEQYADEFMKLKGK